MRTSTFLFGVSQLAASASAINYALVDSYTPSNFFSKFNFITGDDGTGGFANYQTEDAASLSGLIQTRGSSVVFRADNTSSVATTSSGRPSVRLEGTTKYNKGIFVADIQHMPGNACGSWPAFWSFGDTWPNDGEIDIIEGVNKMSKNKASLHSGAGTCTITDEGSSDFGTIGATDCHTLTDSGDVTNTGGCGIDSGKTNSFGDGFNGVNGGYYVTQWTDSFIKIWFFARADKPSTLDCDVPDPSLLGEPDMFFSGCDFGSKFVNQHLVFTTNFCGSWAGATGVYDTAGCPSYDLATPDLNCRKFVAENPSSFTNQFWEVNSIKVFGETSVAGSGVCHSSSSSSRISSSTSSHASSHSSSVTSSVSSSKPATSSKPTTSSFGTVSGRNSSSSFHFPSNGPSVPAGGPTGSGHGGNGGSKGGPSITGSGGPGAKPTNSKGGDDSGYEGHPVYGNNGFPAGCSPVKVPFVTTLTTKLVDVCETGLTTKTITTTVKYCPMCHEQPTAPYGGFTETVKICSQGCGPSPIPVTLTIPCDPTTPAAPGWSIPASPAKPSSPVAPVWGAASTVKTTASASPVWGASSGSVSAAAAPVWGSSVSAVAGAKVSGSASWPLNSTTTYKPVLATVNGASTTFASALVIIAAAVAAVMML